MSVFDKIIGKLGYVKDESTKMSKDLQSDERFVSIFNDCRPYTMTSPERMFSLYQTVQYILNNNIPGDFVECGVWKGGSSMVMAKTLLLNNQSNRKLYLYDTYEGMSEPKAEDVDLDQKEAAILLDQADKNNSASVWCYSSLDEVKSNLHKTNYPSANINFIKGKVEDTIPQTIPTQIALLRLDTDWYESTYHELVHLFPLLVKGGILIIDDYGHWQGARKAVDTYFKEQGIVPLLHRIDYTGRIMHKL